MNGFAQRKEHSKTEIRKAAAELFHQFGITKVSMEDIARRAGVTKATLYNNFGNKENIVRDYVLSGISHLIELGHEILARKISYVEKLQAFFEQIVQMETLNNPLKSDDTKLPTDIIVLNDSEIRKVRGVIAEGVSDLFLEYIREGKKQRCIARDLSEDAARVLLVMIQRGFFEPDIHYQFHNNPKLITDFFTLITFGISGQNR